MPALVDELNGSYQSPGGGSLRRLASIAYNLEDPDQLAQFLQGQKRELEVPGSHRRLSYDPLQRTGVGISRLQTSEAVALGAYAFALDRLDRGPLMRRRRSDAS